MTYSLNEEILNKWAPILEHEDFGPITDSVRRGVSAIMLENLENDMSVNRVNIPQALQLMESSIPVNFMGASSSTAGSGGIDTFDPKLKLNKGKKLRDIIQRKQLSDLKK